LWGDDVSVCIFGYIISLMARLTLLLSTILCILFCSCKKPAKAETITVVDTVFVHDTTYIPGLIGDSATTFIIMRHAEKELTGTDPNLTTDGQARAEELKRVLGNVPVSAIYSTPLNRTRQTVQPLATAKGLTIIEYPTTQPYTDFVNQVSAAGKKKVTVIVGHSNTVPEILKVFSSNTFNVTIADTQYDNLFIVTLSDSAAASIMHLKYGVSTP
jgi:2,3-bisphosphoglycerate-dependent phosphoglycerate mutase